MSTDANRAAGAAGAAPLRPLVLFDGSCPMCSREIAHYRKLRGADAVDWRDIAAPDAPPVLEGIPRDRAMARFHVRDAGGRWQTGAYGFVELWTHLPGYRWLGRLLRTTRLTGLLDVAYGRFARWRLARQHAAAGCEACVATPPGGDAAAGDRRAAPQDERKSRAAHDAAG